MPASASSSSTLWVALTSSVTGVVVATVEQEPGAVVAGMMGAVFYALYGLPSYERWYHVFRALFAGVTAAVVFGSFAASGLVYDVLTGSGLAWATGLAGTMGARGLEWLGYATEQAMRPKRD